MNEILHYLNELREICFSLGKMEFWTYCQFCAYHRIGGFNSGPEYLYRLFDVLPKHTCEMKPLQAQVYIRQWFHVELEAIFI